jgi:hypothetical protein
MKNTHVLKLAIILVSWAWCGGQGSGVLSRGSLVELVTGHTSASCGANILVLQVVDRIVEVPIYKDPRATHRPPLIQVDKELEYFRLKYFIPSSDPYSRPSGGRE